VPADGCHGNILLETAALIPNAELSQTYAKPFLRCLLPALEMPAKAVS
jgi:hypothetical protein